MNIKEKQATWNQERPLFEADFIHSHLLPFFNFNENTGDYEIKSEFTEDEDRKVAFETLNTGWAMWLRAKRGAKSEIDELKAKLEAAKDQVPEGFILVPKEPTEEMMINALAVIATGIGKDHIDVEITKCWEKMIEAARGEGHEHIE